MVGEGCAGSTTCGISGGVKKSGGHDVDEYQPNAGYLMQTIHLHPQFYRASKAVQILFCAEMLRFRFLGLFGRG